MSIASHLRLSFALLIGIALVAPACATARIPEPALLDAPTREAFLDGRAAYWGGEDDRALRLLEPALGVSPAHLASHCVRQDALRSLGRSAELADLYPSPPAPVDPTAWRQVLLAGRVLETSDAKLAEYRRAFSLAPEEAWPRIALAYELIGRATAATERAAAHVDDGAPALAGEARTEATVAWGEATTLVNSLRETHPRLPEVVLVDAALLEATGAPVEALGRAELAAELDPSLWRAHAAVARLLRAAGEDTRAVHALEAALRLAPRLGGLTAELGRALLDLQRDEEARDVLRRAITLRPADVASRVNLAVALTRLGELDEAESIAVIAAAERPRDARIAEVLRRIRRVRAAPSAD